MVPKKHPKTFLRNTEWNKPSFWISVFVWLSRLQTPAPATLGPQTSRTAVQSLGQPVDLDYVVTLVGDFIGFFVCWSLFIQSVQIMSGFFVHFFLRLANYYCILRSAMSHWVKHMI